MPFPSAPRHVRKQDKKFTAPVGGPGGTFGTVGKKNVIEGSCGRRLANDMGRCDRKKGHSGSHSNRFLRMNPGV